MQFPDISPRVPRLVGLVAVVATVALGIILRLVDPLSTPVIPAEDPYTHMVLVKEHLRTGALESLNPNGGLYPPGMHAFLGALWVFSGVDLYQMFRFTPVLLGGIGVLMMGALLWRQAGPVAGFVGALGYAVAPEIIFRTTMMSPTALDLAIVPVFLYAALEIIEDDLRWLGVALPMAIFMVFAHPWLFGILAITGGVLAVLTILAPGSEHDTPRPSAIGVSLVLATVAGGLALSMSGCLGMCGPGFAGLLPGAFSAWWVTPAILAGGILPAVAIAVWPDRAKALFSLEDRTSRPWWVRTLVAAGLAGALGAVTWPALQQGFPEHVTLVRMFGWPILAVAASAFVALPFLPNRAAHAGAALCVATYPFVIYNPLDSPFWPHRTSVFLGIGLVLLLGVASAALVRWSKRALATLGPASLASPSRRTAAAVLAVPALLIASLMGGAVYAGTPDGYEGGWYRLYEPCELDGFEQIADRIGDQPGAFVATGSWQSRLVLGSISDNASRVQAPHQFTTNEQARDRSIGHILNEHDRLYMVVDRHLSEEHPTADTSFLDEDPWQEVDQWCDATHGVRAGVTLYAYQGAQR